MQRQGQNATTKKTVAASETITTTSVINELKSIYNKKCTSSMYTWVKVYKCTTATIMSKQTSEVQAEINRAASINTTWIFQ